MQTRILLLFLFAYTAIPARDGMWMPQDVGRLNEKEMQDMGLQLNASDLYSLEHTSLKDAVVRFGTGCTGEVISGQGLVLTNHHCGFSFIQALSTLEKNYLDSGYWATTYGDELPCKGLTITFIKKIENVTPAVMSVLGTVATETDRDARIKVIADSIEKKTEKESGLQATVKSFFYGNEYYLITSRIFKDIRLVGAAPVSVGRFGGETDNWTWPRHTADFALFRIYADTANNPAEYSTANRPYQPTHFLPSAWMV
jgi:hypothetical protein